MFFIVVICAALIRAQNAYLQDVPYFIQVDIRNLMDILQALFAKQRIFLNRKRDI